MQKNYGIIITLKITVEETAIYFLLKIFNLSTIDSSAKFRTRKVQPAYLDSLGVVNGRIRRRGIGKPRGRERSAR